MCEFKNMFVVLDELENGHVTFGDAFKIPVKDNGKILIQSIYFKYLLCVQHKK